MDKHFKHLFLETLNEFFESDRGRQLLNTNSSTYPKYMTTKQVADYVQICLRTVSNYVNSGRLKPIKMEGKVMFDREDIDKMMQSLKEN